MSSDSEFSGESSTLLELVVPVEPEDAVSSESRGSSPIQFPVRKAFLPKSAISPELKEATTFG